MSNSYNNQNNRINGSRIELPKSAPPNRNPERRRAAGSNSRPAKAVRSVRPVDDDEEVVTATTSRQRMKSTNNTQKKKKRKKRPVAQNRESERELQRKKEANRKAKRKKKRIAEAKNRKKQEQKELRREESAAKREEKARRRQEKQDIKAAKLAKLTPEELAELKMRKKMVNYLTLVYLFVFALIGLIIATGFKINEIEVSGNVHYTDNEIKTIISSNGYVNNSIIMNLKNKIDPIEDIPFIEKMDIEYVSSHKVAVTVYEKAMAGCIEYMNKYVYFDKDGLVLETSDLKFDDIPCVEGITVESMTLHQVLPIEDKHRFRLILTITQLLSKYDLDINTITFTNEDEIVLKYKDIKILLGEGDNIDEQLVDLGTILEKLDGKKGTLDMRDFTSDDGRTIFKLD